VKNSGDKVFDGLPTSKDEATLLGQYLAGHDLAAETRPPVPSEKVSVGPQKPQGVVLAFTHWVPRSIRQAVVGNIEFPAAKAQMPCRAERVI
jgi:hypothetical protein